MVYTLDHVNVDRFMESVKSVWSKQLEKVEAQRLSLFLGKSDQEALERNLSIRELAERCTDNSNVNPLYVRIGEVTFHTFPPSLT
jgi:hypothetical protein